MHTYIHTYYTPTTAPSMKENGNQVLMTFKKEVKKECTTLLLLANLLADHQNSYGQNSQTWLVNLSLQTQLVYQFLVFPIPAVRFNFQNPDFIPTYPITFVI